ncbi:MAG: aldo/keto reductase [Planctomycetota bacterium]|jgi:aryl-alcohol dehydrogenase-like predicted oxidoreductase
MTKIPRVPLGDDGYSISRLLVGGWQLSQGHRKGDLDEARLMQDLERMVEAGFTSFDCADIYTGVEELFGRFVAQSRSEVQIHTKYVPDQNALVSLSRRDVEQTIDRSLQRLQVERLDLVQFAWWDYGVPGYVEAALWLNELREAGKIRNLGATNFDVPRMREMLDAGVPLVCNQVQYSLLDRRPEGTGENMAALCEQRGLDLLCYGSLAGGFLSEKYLDQPEPSTPLGTRSLSKYKLIIDEFGGWDRFQDLLRCMARIAERHGVSIPAVALRWNLDRPQVAGVIVGTYHGGHMEQNLVACALELDGDDLAKLEAVTSASSGPSGEVFGLERDVDGPHARLFWKNLNRRN